MKKNTRKTGYQYEEVAVKYLEEKRYQIVEQNFYTHHGEIDIIAMEHDTIVFVEVKYRSTLRNGYPEEAVNPVKQMRIRKSAEYYLYKTGKLNEKCRFDVIAITKERISHIKDAF